jgi:ABC-2 type transport system permease protein
MVSSAFVAPSLMPDWLGAIAMWNPVSSTLTASRECSATRRHALLMAVVWPIAVTAVFLPLAVRRHHRRV